MLLLLSGLTLWLATPFLLRFVPLPAALLQPHSPDPEFVDRNGISLRELPGAKGFQGRLASLQEVSDSLVHATLAAEDKRFWKHNGVDWRASLRAALGFLHNGRVISGGSTISQQVIKLAEPRPRTLRTKIIEAAQAMRLEQVWSKERILTEYLNRLDYGHRRFGAVAAAEFYFAKPPSDLSDAEAAFLAGLPQSPTRLDPHAHFDRARKRQQWILQREQLDGFVSAAAASRAVNEPIHLQQAHGPFRAPHFVDLLLQQDAQLQFGVPPSGDSGLGIAKGPPKGGTPSLGTQHNNAIPTTLDLPLNDFVQQTLRDRLARLNSKNVQNGAVVVIENRTGNVLVLVGSEDYFAPDAGQVNGAWAPRSAGSTFKPFTYLLALERGATPASIVTDLPIEFPTSTGVFAPLNYDRRCYGPMRYRLALANSLNISAVRVLDSIGGPAVLQDRLQECGLTTLQHPPEYYGLGLTIGNAEARLLELANAYATLARLGEYRPVNLQPSGDWAKTRPVPELLLAGARPGLRWQAQRDTAFARTKKVGNLNDFRPPESAVAAALRPRSPKPGGETQVHRGGNGEGGRSSPLVFDPGACYLIADILGDNFARTLAFGPNSSLHFDFPVACKTGTSSDFRDNWAFGFTPEFTVGVWVGNFDGSPMQDVSGVSGAAPVLHDVFVQLHQRFGTSWFTPPADIVERWINPVTGKLCARNEPGAVREKFLRRNLPPAETPADFDAQGRIRLPSEYRAWLAGAQNWLNGRAVASDDTASTSRLCIVSPQPGATYYLDPDLPTNGSLLLLNAAAAGMVNWRSKTLPIQSRNGRSFAVMNAGRHELVARDEKTGAETTTWIWVKSL